jgi:phosphoribosyl-ATP pyrophosphohydrolase/phosphoribosyl-AMP cyclohydrolase
MTTGPGQIDFDKDGTGLVPAVVQDARTGEVLMLAWQNREALEATVRDGEATFWSRSRRELWRKGATSGHVQRVKGLATDCDRDAVLMQVEPAGPACHTGERTCFHERVEGAGPVSSALRGLVELERTLEERRVAPPEGSYVAKLYADESKRHKKVGEEATELVVASLRGKRDEVVTEAADLLFHAMVLLRSHGVALAEVAAELERRVGAPRRE